MRHLKPPLSRTLQAATILLFTASLLVPGLAFAQHQPDGQIDQQITKTLFVLHPTATGHIDKLSDIRVPYQGEKEIGEFDLFSHPVYQPRRSTLPDQPDGSMQLSSGPLVPGGVGLSFDGLGVGFTGPLGAFTVNSVPPDPNLAVGTTQMVQTVNSGFAIFDKTTGGALFGPYNIQVLWSGLPANAPCTGTVTGEGVSLSDPVVSFDQMAQRWIVSILALPYNTSTGAYIPPFYHCVAYSTSADASGGWDEFQYNPGSYSGITNDLPDYPKQGVWRDAYTFTYDMFNSTGSAYVAGLICGMDRNAILGGSLSPTILCFEKTSTDYALLPATMDGALYPPLQTSGTAGTDNCSSGSPCQPKSIFFELQDVAGSSTLLEYYRVHFNFTTTSHSAVDARGTITVSSYNTTTCSTTSQCVPQPTHTGSLPSGETFASESKLDTLADHAMWRAAYRNFGSYESVVFDSTVRGTTTNTAEPRWYELRGINSSTGTGTPTVNQQATFNPDTNVIFRFMGSIAADHNNNMLLGYSGSNSSIFPSLYVTGRLVGDTASTMETEQQVYLGQNSQVNVTISGNSYPYGYRWGDYSSVVVDPDDCTFWYTNEYLKQAGLFNWSTRVFNWNFGSSNCTSLASITLPIPNAQGGAALTSATATFLWTPGTGNPTYTLAVGSTQGGSNYCGGPQSYGAGTYTATLSCLPVDGSTFWVRLTSITTPGGFQDYQYTAPLLAQATTTSVSSSVNPSTYGQNVLFTATVTAGGNPVTSGTVQFVVDGSNFGSAVALNGSGQATSGSTQTLTAGSHSVQANYSGSGSYLASSGSLNQSVNPAVLTVTANSTAITYGCGCAPVLTYTMTGFVLGQSQGTATTGQPAEGTTGTQGGPVGVYPITISQGTLTATNYTFTSVGGSLTVNPATLTVTADNKTATEGDGLPTFTATYSGFVNGDNQGVLGGAPNFSTDAPSGPPVGTWNIFVTQGTLAATNYVFTFVNGSLTVNPAVAQLTAPPKSTMLSGSSVTFNWSHETGGVSYTLNLGTTAGGSDIASVTTPNLNTTVNGLPTDGSYIYATLLGSTDGTNYTTQDSGLYVAFSQIAVMISPMPGTTFAGSPVTFNWVAGAGSSAYWIDVGSTQYGNEYYQSGNLGTALTATVNSLPNDGSTVYVTLWSLVGGNWLYNEYTYTAYNNGSTKGVITSPTPGSMLGGSSQQFTWTPGTQSTAYWIDAGSTQGGNQYFQSGNIGNVTTYTVSGLPTDGSTVYITLWSLVGGNWLNNQYTYTAYSAGGATGQITTPTPGSTLTGSTVVFNWTAGSGSTAYWLDAGSTPGGNQYFQSGNLGNVLTVTVNGLPTDGSTVYVTLYSLVGGNWVANAYTYTAFSSTGALGVMQTPTPGSTLSGNSATFTWSAGSGASAYWMDIGSSAGGNDIYQSGNLGNVLTTTVNSLPADGSTIYVTLYSYVGGQWLSNPYTYVSGP